MAELRILHVASDLRAWGGIERHICDVVPSLASRGHNVTVVCRPGSPVEEHMNESSIRTFPLTITGRHDWGKLPALVRTMAGRFDVIHTHQGWDKMLPSVAARLVRTPAVVMTEHDGYRFSTGGALMKRALYDGFIGVSEFVGCKLLEQGINPQRVFVIRNGIDMARWKANPSTSLRKEFAIPDNAFLIAAAGRLARNEKGFPILLRGVALARQGGINAFCVIAGGRGDPLPLETLISSLDLAPFAKYIGVRRDIANLFAAANAVAVPSTWPEAFGYTALEGLASGRPVIASRVGGLGEIVTPDVGYLLPPGDPEAIAIAIQELAANPERCRSMGEAALARAKHFSLDECVRKLEQVYECLVRS